MSTMSLGTAVDVGPAANGGKTPPPPARARPGAEWRAARDAGRISAGYHSHLEGPMKRFFGIAASAVVVLGLAAQAPGQTRIASLTPAVAATAAAPAGLSINGIHGGAVPPSTVESFEWGVSNGGASNTSAGSGTGKAQFSNLRVTIPIDQTAPAIAA